MTEKYDLPPYVLSRVRYYDGEFLKDEDFIDDQKFHMDRHRRHERLMHAAGIAEGLDISVVPDATGTRLKVSAGTALDSLGRQILLSTDQLIDIKPAWTATSGSVWTMTIRFNEKEDHPSDANSTVQGNTRFTQEPIIDVVEDVASIQAHRPVVLGQVRFVTGQLPAVLGARAFAGLRLPGPGATSFSLQVTEERGAARPLTVGLKGSLTIGTGTNGTLNVRNINGKHHESDEPDPLFLNVKNRQPVHIGSKDDPAGLEVSGRVGSTGLRVTGDATISGILSTGGSVGIGTPNPTGPLDVVIPGAVPGWDRLVVTANADWGDDTNKYVTLGTGAAGIMLSNVHIPWHKDDGRSSIRYGRSGGVKSGAYWDVGARANNAFSLSYDGHTDHKLWLSSNGHVGIGTSDPKVKLHVSGGDVAFTGDLTVGDGQNGTITVRHINGKRWDNNNHDVLALNHQTGHFVVVGSAEKHSGIHVFGATYLAGQVIVGKGGSAVLHTHSIEGKSYLNDDPDVLHLNWGNGKPVSIGNPGALSSLAVYGTSSVTGDMIIGKGRSAALHSRHINGKSYLNDDPDMLCLNWGNRKPVYVGSSEHTTSLTVFGPTQATEGVTACGVCIGRHGNGDLIYDYAYETVGVTDRGFNLRLQSPNEVVVNASAGFHVLNNAQLDGTLHVNGSIYEEGRKLWDRYQPRSGSDARLKRDVASIDEAMEKLRQIRAVSFFWKDEKMGTKRELGVIAQEVEPVIPELVEAGEDGYLRVKYDKFTPMLIQALKEQDERIAQLEERLGLMKATA